MFVVWKKWCTNLTLEIAGFKSIYPRFEKGIFTIGFVVKKKTKHKTNWSLTDQIYQSSPDLKLNDFLLSPQIQ